MKESTPLPTPRLLLALARYRGGVYAWMTLLVIILPYLFGLVPGLVARNVFDIISGEAPAGLNVWSVLALFIAATFVSEVAVTVGFWLEGIVMAAVESLLRHN